MIEIAIEKLIVFQLIHILLTLVAIFVNVELISVESRSTFSEFFSLSFSSVLIKRGHLSKGEYARNIDQLILGYVFILVNNQMEIYSVVIEKSCYFHQNKIRVPSPVTKQVGIHQSNLNVFLRHSF